ncbi:acetylornithine/succinyldiaminopimelate transaminase [Litorivicinus sp.]|nr:acetylornithine/succinyldiaminopimelate transaminase [Litorivicinus sp.]
MTDLNDFQTFMTPNYGTPPIIMSHGIGSTLWDQNGRKFLDFAGGIAVSALGHSHPEMVSALTKQAAKLWHLSNTLANEPAIELAKALVQATFADRVFLCNSGAEANEAAIKAARRAAFNQSGIEKFEIICFDNAFHGRTIATVTAGGQAKYREGFGPMPGGFTHLPFNDCKSLDKTISEKTCAIMVEAIQGEGGVRPICPTFFEKIRAGCDRVGAALIVDEVQTGMGRTGKLFAYEHTSFEPDILTSAKSLGCGFPVGAMLCKNWIAKHFIAGTHGSTYGGNPLAAAVALKALALINTPEMNAAVTARSEQLQKGLHVLNKKYQLFQTIRGKGLLIGAVLESSYADKAHELVALGQKQGLLTLIAGANVHRMAPPLIISSTEIEDGLTRLECVYSDFKKLFSN